MKNLSPEVKKLISEGYWSLYRIKPIGIYTHYLKVPERKACCSLHSGPGSDWLVDDDGNHIRMDWGLKPEIIEVFKKNY